MLNVFKNFNYIVFVNIRAFVLAKNELKKETFTIK